MVAVKCAVSEVCSCTVVSKQKRYELIMQNHNFKRNFYSIWHIWIFFHEIIYSTLKYSIILYWKHNMKDKYKDVLEVPERGKQNIQSSITLLVD